MNHIPKVYIDQALKPKGITINERLSFLIAWYNKSATTVNPSDAHQAHLMQLMGQWSNMLKDEALSDDNEITKQNILNFLDRVERQAAENLTSYNSARNSFFFYLDIELRRVIDPNSI
jgi:hypothetical protein